jgi:3'(2'), 5'-bisphosphate nucleotidase
MDLAAELTVAEDLARRAGAIILRHRAAGLVVSHKAYGEVVTDADREANALILGGLRAAFPADAVLSEEDAEIGSHERAARVWMVDPLDGTRDYVAGKDGFAVMLGLVVGARPVLGVVYQPLSGLLYRAAAGVASAVTADGEAHALCVSPIAEPARTRLISSASRRLPIIDALRAALGTADEVALGSVGLKVGLIAAGERDVYVNPEGSTKLWDTCAPEAILVAAGGQMTDLGGAPITYRRPDLANHRGLVATNGALHAAVVAVTAGFPVLEQT